MGRFAAIDFVPGLRGKGTAVVPVLSSTSAIGRNSLSFVVAAVELGGALKVQCALLGGVQRDAGHGTSVRLAI